MKSSEFVDILEASRVYKPTVIEVFFILTIRTHQHCQINGCKKVILSVIV